jgi:hypothetical protein
LGVILFEGRSNMCSTENFILYIMKKDGRVMYVDEKQVDEYLRNGWKKGKAEDLGGKK